MCFRLLNRFLCTCDSVNSDAFNQGGALEETRVCVQVHDLLMPSDMSVSFDI